MRTFFFGNFPIEESNECDINLLLYFFVLFVRIGKKARYIKGLGADIFVFGCGQNADKADKICSKRSPTLYYTKIVY